MKNQTLGSHLLGLLVILVMAFLLHRITGLEWKYTVVVVFFIFQIAQVELAVRELKEQVATMNKAKAPIIHLNANVRCPQCRATMISNQCAQCGYDLMSALIKQHVEGKG